MNELQIFNYKDSEVRTVIKDGEPWWVLKDVCGVLKLAQPHRVAARLDEDDRTQMTVTDSIGRSQDTTVISESGLYNVILRSDKPEAKDFKRWVTREVLPSIRKHGAYMTPATLADMLTNPEGVMLLLTALKDEQDKNRELAEANAALVPKAEYFDDLVERNTLTSFRDTAKELGVPQKEFINFLIKKRYVYRDESGKLTYYARKNTGLFKTKECTGRHSDWSGIQTLITPKGRETFRLLLQKEGY